MNKIIKSYLHRHEVYINRRIEIIFCEIKNSNTDDGLLLNILFYMMGTTTACPSLPHDTKVAIDELSSLLATWDIISDGDLLGYIYQGLSSHSFKKTHGQYFTPSPIVDHIVRSLITSQIDYKNIKILDPACGSGQFLISIYQLLLTKYIENGYDKNTASKIIISNNIYGCDVDPLAVEITKYNLQKACGKDVDSMNIFHCNFIESINDPEITLITKTEFDFILGNPPWGCSFSNSQKTFLKKTFRSAETGINSFTLFIEKALSLLSKKGKVSFLIPEAYLNIKAHKNSRAFILDSCRILEITTWGEQFKKVFAPSISLLIQKSLSQKERNENVIQIRDARTIESGTARLIPQHSYNFNYENIFNIHFSKKSETIITKIKERGFLSLKNNARFFLGIVTGSNNQFLSNDYSIHHPDQILIGRDIEKYKVTYSGTYFKFDPNKLQQVAPKAYYSTKKKILYKFIGKNLTFAVDDTGYYTLNNVNGFISEFSNCDPEYLVALLNSPVIQYFYENSFFTVKVLKGNLEKLPLKILAQKEMKRISTLSQQVSTSNSIIELEKYTDQINDIFFHAYGISDRDAARIMYKATKEDLGQDFLFDHLRKDFY
jgi:predicted RNA methylase